MSIIKNKKSQAGAMSFWEINKWIILIVFVVFVFAWYYFDLGDKIVDLIKFFKSFF